MKAEPEDYNTFFEYIKRLSQFGNGQSSEEAAFVEDILDKFRQASSGIIGRKCACGKDGVASCRIQPKPSWPMEYHVVCDYHLGMVKSYEVFMKQIVSEENGVV